MKFIIIILFFCNINVFASQNLGKVLTQNNFQSIVIDRFFQENPSLVDLKILYTKKLVGLNGELKLNLYIENSNEIYIIQKNNDEISFEKSLLKYQIVKKFFEGKITNSLYTTMLTDFNDEDFALKITDAFKDEFSSTKGLKVESSYQLNAELVLEGDEVIGISKVLSAKLTVGKATVEKVLMKDLDKNILILKNVIPTEDQRIFESPVESNIITSLFNLARKHPVKRRIQPHNGIDFRAKSGTPVYPALDGEIVAIGRARAKGKFVLIRHSNGFETTYDHLRKFTKGLRVGSYVDTKDQIGEVGRTGYATGAHLHFGILKDGEYVNPIYYLKNYQIESGLDSEFEEFEESTQE